ncbi:MAG TPA: TIGR03087 family PEP-CTERM/XrtA system glycosyltransferase [Crenotrichaceae bacterium]|nr:TIGR03087 family PEP-CTERM/XrtA system glycosyltransferase [Crenotrichaceae bacterium]
MKILYLCHRFPYPGNDGSRVRSFHLIQHFTTNGHQVTVASLVRSDQEATAGQPLKKHCKKVIMARVNETIQNIRMVAYLLTPTPSSMAYFYSKTLARRIDEEIQNNRPDLIYVHCSSVAPYVADYDIPKIMDFVDMDSAKWLIYAKFKSFPINLGYWYEGVKLRRAEKKLAQRFTISTCITQTELDTLTGYNLKIDGDWFPNGVDHQFFCPDDQQQDYDSNTISFIGRMDYYPNIEAMLRFCSDIFPLIREHNPNAKLIIIGANPVNEIKALEQHNGITVTGTVEDVRPYVRQSAVMVAPLKIARGTQNKILEAMSMGVPVVCSEIAARGVNAVDNTHILVAADNTDCAKKIINLLENPVQRQQFSEAGRDLIGNDYTWEKAMQRVDSIINRCLVNHSR